MSDANSMTRRINIRVTNKVNDWLDRRSAETGLSKSALAFLMIESQIKQDAMVDTLPELLERLGELEKKISYK